MNKAQRERYLIPAKNPATNESSEQIALVDWIDTVFIRAHGYRASMVFHPASESKRSPQMGLRMKRMGMLPGIPDIVHDGFQTVLELKHGDNLPTEYQAWWLMNYSSMNWHPGVAYNATEGIEFLLWIAGVRRNGIADMPLEAMPIAVQRYRLMAHDWVLQSYAKNPWDVRNGAPGGAAGRRRKGTRPW